MKRKIIKRLSAAVAAAVMLFSSMTVLAAAPAQAGSPKWTDVLELIDYVGENVYDKGVLFIDDVSGESPYYEAGKLLGDFTKEQTYCSFVEGSGVFANPPDSEEGMEAAVDKTNYDGFYTAAMALVGSVQAASGTKYVKDIIDEAYNLYQYGESIDRAVARGQIIVVDSADDAPDTAEMTRGLTGYWIQIWLHITVHWGRCYKK